MSNRNDNSQAKLNRPCRIYCQALFKLEFSQFAKIKKDEVDVPMQYFFKQPMIDSD